jgi:predicted type IV restriction endonuclease
VTDLVETLNRCGKWLDRYRSQGRNVGEQNTKAGLVEPILEGLGWDIRDPDEVHREYRRLPSDNPVDYALLLRRTPRLFVEAKGIGENLDDPKWAKKSASESSDPSRILPRHSLLICTFSPIETGLSPATSCGAT